MDLGRAASITGIVGGALGMAAAGVALLAGAVVGVAGHTDVALIVLAHGLAALLLGLAGIAGALIVRAHRRLGLVLLFGPGVIGFFCVWTFWVPAGCLLLAAGLMEGLVSGGRGATTRSPMKPLRAEITKQLQQDLPGRDPSFLEIQEDRATGGFLMHLFNQNGRSLAQEWYLMLSEAKDAARRRFAVEESDWG
jgi:hypothetical protein